MLLVPQLSPLQEAPGGAIAADLRVLDRAGMMVADGADGLCLADPSLTWVSDHVRCGRIVEGLARLSVPLGLDASLHDPAAIDRCASMPFSWIVVSHHAAYDPALLRWAVDTLGQRIRVEIRVDGGELVDVPPHLSNMTAVDLVRSLRLHGVSDVIVRDLGTHRIAPEIAWEIRAQSSTSVTYSAPLRGLPDVRRCAEGGDDAPDMLVLGEALHDGRIRLVDAQRAARGDG